MLTVFFKELLLSVGREVDGMGKDREEEILLFSVEPTLV